MTATFLPRASAPSAVGAVTGVPNLLLRAEGLVVLGATIAAYAQADTSWWLFALFLLAPDLLMVGYLGGSWTGAVTYNLGHTYIGPLVLLILGYGLAAPLLWAAGLIWAAHIGMDRALGYGLKYARGFKGTHLGGDDVSSPVLATMQE